MRGHIRKRGNTWSYIINRGNQQVQRCVTCGARSWLDYKPLDACAECGGELQTRTVRRQQEVGGHRTRTDAQTALNKMLGCLQDGNYVNPDKVTLGEYLTNEWLPAMKLSMEKPSSYKSYETTVNRHIIPALGSIRLQKLSPVAINAFYARLLEEPRKPVEQPKKKKATTDELGSERKESEKILPPLSVRTVRRIHVTLHKALADAVDLKKLSNNPAAAAKPPKHKQRCDIHPWTAQQAKDFLASARDTREYAMWLTFLTTGMRRAEIAGLRWEDLRESQGKDGRACAWFHVQHTRTAVGYDVVDGAPKSGKGRAVPLDERTLAALKALRHEYKKEKLAWGAGYTDSGLVFTREDGTGYHPDFISKSFERAVRKSGQPRIRLHDLRHTYATLALVGGLNIKALSATLGHASVAFTLDVYSHVTPDFVQVGADIVAGQVIPA